MIFKRRPKHILVFCTPEERTQFFNKEHEKLTELKECIYSGQPNKDEIKFIAWRRRTLFKDEKASYKAFKRGGNANCNTTTPNINAQTNQECSLSQTQQPLQSALIQPSQPINPPQTTTEIKAISVKTTSTTSTLPDEIIQNFQTEIPPEGEYYE